MRRALLAALLCLAAGAARADRIELSWPPAADAEWFAVERRPADGVWQEVARVAASRAGWADATASPERTWCYRVQAQRSDGSRRLHAREHCVAPVSTPGSADADATQRRVRVRGGWLQEVEP